jgi:bacteriorhodopsin
LYGYDGCICIFLLSLSQFDKNGVLQCFSGLITFIAAVHYFSHEIIGQLLVNRLLFRYVDWVLTVPLMCLEFYLILKVAGG